MGMANWMDYLLMTGIPNDKSNVIFRRKRNTFGNIGRLRNIDSKIDIIAQRAGNVFGGERNARIARVKRCHLRRR